MRQQIKQTPVDAAMLLISTLFLGLMVYLKPGLDNIVDLLNYHAYNGWAISTGLWWEHFHPAYVHSYYLSYTDIFHWFLIDNLTAGVLLLILHTVQLSIVIPIYLIGRELLPNLAKIRILSLSVLSLSTAIFLAQLGSFNGDIISALPMLYGLWLLLRYSRRETNPKTLIIAGILVAMSLTLKLTNMVFLPLFIAILIVILINKDWKGAISISLSALFFFIFFMLPQTLVILGESGTNPLFPMYNNIFKSVRAPEQSLHSNVGLDSDLSIQSQIVNEVLGSVQKDPRIFIYSSLIIFLFIFLLVSGLKRRRVVLETGLEKSNKDLLQIAFVFGVYGSFLFESFQFGVERYGMVIELLFILAIFIIINIFVENLKRRIPIYNVASILILASIVSTVNPMLIFPFTPSYQEKMFAKENIVAINEYDAIIITSTAASWLAVVNREYVQENKQAWLSAAFNKEDAEYAKATLENAIRVGYITEKGNTEYANKNLETLGYTGSEECKDIKTQQSYGLFYDNFIVCEALYTGEYSYNVSLLDRTYLGGESISKAPLTDEMIEAMKPVPFR